MTASFAAVVAVVLFAVLGVIGGALFGLLGASLLTSAWLLLARLRATAMVLDLSEVEPADEERHARLFNVTGGLCMAMGVSPPALYVVNDPARNAMVVGCDERGAALVVTQGLLDVVSLVELEAVVAHQLYRIKSAETLPETLVVPTVGAALLLGERFDRWDWLQRLLFLPLPLLEATLVWLHPAQVEIDTDVDAMRFTRYPPALASALGKMDGHSVLAMGSAVTAHMWIAPSLATGSHPSFNRLHASMSERIAILQEL